MDYERLKSDLRRDEGVRRTRYLDTVGKWTIGVGHNIDADTHYPYAVSDEPLSDADIDLLLEEDIARVVAALDENLNWWRACPEPVQRVLCGLAFNMGINGLLGFKNTLDAIHFNKWDVAAAGILGSKYGQQVGARAQRYASVLLAQKGA